METITSTPPILARGEKAKARDILTAIRTLQRIEHEQRPATPDERQALARFGGFGAVALHIFPDPVTGQYKDAGWQVIGEELQSLLTPEEYASAKKSTFNAFYTSPTVIAAMHAALARLGVPPDATVLEPGCGTGNFMAMAPAGMKFIGVELDGISGRIARALHPGHDIRIESFSDTKLPQVDAVLGNPPFADVKLDYHGQKLPLHDFFITKSVDSLKPGGILALVTSHFTLDKQNAAVREDLASKADFLGAIRLPSDAFKQEGTSVVTDILFLRKRAPANRRTMPTRPGSTPPRSPSTAPTSPSTAIFSTTRSMVLGRWSRKDRLYSAGYSVESTGDLADQLAAAIRRLPEAVASLAATPVAREAAPAFTPPPLERHVTEGSFFVGDDKIIHQVERRPGRARDLSAARCLTPPARMTGKRLAALVGLRDHARRVLQSQNEGWPEAHRDAARRDLNRAYDRFVASYGPINKTTFSETSDGTVIRRMPNLVKFREDPDAMLVMALEDYDEVTAKATKAAIMHRDVVGPTPSVTSVATAEEGLLVSLDRKGTVDLPYIATSTASPRRESSPSWAT